MAGARGEAILTLTDGRAVRLLYTNRALADAEARLGRGTLRILKELLDGEGGLGDMAVLLQVGMDAARRDAKHQSGASTSRAEAWEILDDLGFAIVANAVMEGVATVLSFSPNGDEGGDLDEEPSDPPA